MTEDRRIQYEARPPTITLASAHPTGSKTDTVVVGRSVGIRPNAPSAEKAADAYPASDNAIAIGKTNSGSATAAVVRFRMIPWPADDRGRSTENIGFTNAQPTAMTVTRRGMSEGITSVTANVRANAVTTSVIDVRNPNRKGISDSPSRRRIVSKNAASAADRTSGNSTNVIRRSGLRATRAAS